MRFAREGPFREGKIEHQVLEIVPRLERGEFLGVYRAVPPGDGPAQCVDGIHDVVLSSAVAPWRVLTRFSNQTDTIAAMRAVVTPAPILDNQFILSLCGMQHALCDFRCARSKNDVLFHS